jgi:hypothetical protein
MHASESPSGRLVAVTAHDTNPIVAVVAGAPVSQTYTRGIYIGSIAGGATLTVIDRNGSTVAFAGLVAGSILPIQVSHVKSTGTLASSIVALF